MDTLPGGQIGAGMWERKDVIKRLFQYIESRDSKAHKGKIVVTAQMLTCLVQRCYNWRSAGLGTVWTPCINRWKATGQEANSHNCLHAVSSHNSRNSHRVCVFLLNTLGSALIFSVIHCLAGSSQFLVAGKWLTPNPHLKKCSLLFVLCITMSFSNA